MKIPFKNLIKRLTGFSTPIFGISWDPPESERDIARKLIIYLEDKRVLYYPFDMEDPQYVVSSILEIRKYLTKTLQNLSEDSQLFSHFRSMRSACRKFLDYFDKSKLGPRFYYLESLTKLGELRAIFGFNLAQICVKYGIDINSELATILPEEDEDINE